MSWTCRSFLTPGTSHLLDNAVDLSFALSRRGTHFIDDAEDPPPACRLRGPADLLPAPQTWLIARRCLGRRDQSLAAAAAAAAAAAVDLCHRRHGPA